LGVERITEGVGRYFPREWERFRDAVPPSLRGERLVDAYARLLADPDPAVPAPGATGRTRMYGCAPISRLTRATRTPASGCGSRAWSPITGATTPGWRTTRSWPAWRARGALGAATARFAATRPAAGSTGAPRTPAPRTPAAGRGPSPSGDIRP